MLCLCMSMGYVKNDRMTNKKGKINFHGEEACEAVSK